MQTSDGGWHYQTESDTIETYNASGQLISVARRGKAPITVNYASGAGLGDPPISVSEASGHTLTFSYTTTGVTERLSSITDPSGNTIQYGYNSYEDLASVTYQDGTKRGYNYDNNYALLSETDESGAAYRSWAYTSYETAVTSSKSAGGVDDYSYSYSPGGAAGSVTMVDPLGQSCTYGQQLIWGSYYQTSAWVSSPTGPRQ